MGTCSAMGSSIAANPLDGNILPGAKPLQVVPPLACTTSTICSGTSTYRCRARPRDTASLHHKYICSGTSTYRCRARPETQPVPQCAASLPQNPLEEHIRRLPKCHRQFLHVLDHRFHLWSVRYKTRTRLLANKLASCLSLDSKDFSSAILTHPELQWAVVSPQKPLDEQQPPRANQHSCTPLFTPQVPSVVGQPDWQPVPQCAVSLPQNPTEESKLRWPGAADGIPISSSQVPSVVTPPTCSS